MIKLSFLLSEIQVQGLKQIKLKDLTWDKVKDLDLIVPGIYSNRSKYSVHSRNEYLVWKSLLAENYGLDLIFQVIPNQDIDKFWYNKPYKLIVAHTSNPENQKYWGDK